MNTKYILNSGKLKYNEIISDHKIGIFAIVDQVTNEVKIKNLKIYFLKFVEQKIRVTKLIGGHWGSVLYQIRVKRPCMYFILIYFPNLII